MTTTRKISRHLQWIFNGASDQCDVEFLETALCSMGLSGADAARLARGL